MLLLGETRDEFGGSAWASVVHGHLGGRPPHRTSPPSGPWPSCSPPPPREGLVTSAHDLADGGLAVALAESCLAGKIGARIEDLGPDDPAAPLSPFAALFSESTARVVVSRAPSTSTPWVSWPRRTACSCRGWARWVARR